MVIKARFILRCARLKTELRLLVFRPHFRNHFAVPDELKDALVEFARFARSIRGDEKGEAQPFLDHFFRALGHKGSLKRLHIRVSHREKTRVAAA